MCYFSLIRTESMNNSHTQSCQTQTGSPFSPEDQAVSFLATTKPKSNPLQLEVLINVVHCMPTCNSDTQLYNVRWWGPLLYIKILLRMTTFFKYHTRLFLLSWSHLSSYSHSWCVLKFWCHGRRLNSWPVYSKLNENMELVCSFYFKKRKQGHVCNIDKVKDSKQEKNKTYDTHTLTSP